jgi:hypothetical protein
MYRRAGRVAWIRFRRCGRNRRSSGGTGGGGYEGGGMRRDARVPRRVKDRKPNTVSARIRVLGRRRCGKGEGANGDGDVRGPRVGGLAGHADGARLARGESGLRWGCGSATGRRATGSRLRLTASGLIEIAVRDRARLGGIEGGRLDEVEEGIGPGRRVASGREARGGERWGGVGKPEMA